MNIGIADTSSMRWGNRDVKRECTEAWYPHPPNREVTVAVSPARRIREQSM
ncbi:hypothetical protein ACWF99_21980 [Nocardia sp. NPDC055002]